jgi:hypothetical protein
VVTGKQVIVFLQSCEDIYLLLIFFISVPETSF